jgi:hypothetical protein
MIASLSAFGVIIVVVVEDNILLAVVLMPVPLLAIMERLIMLVLITGLYSGLLVLAEKMRDKGRLENDSTNRQ